MSEWNLVLLVALRILYVSMFTMCYVVGGRKYKWVRRFLGSFIMGIAVFQLSLTDDKFTPLIFISIGILCGGLCMGYGGSDFWTKFFRRLLYGSVIGLAGLSLGFFVGNLTLGIIQFALAVQASILFGMLHPANSAVDEEALIAAQSVFLLPFIV